MRCDSIKTKIRNIPMILFSCLIFLFCFRVKVSAGSISYMSDYKGVTISPDGTAWTTDYMDKTNEQLFSEYTIHTGISSSLRSLEAGEHYYLDLVHEKVPIGKWVVKLPDPQCIHGYEAMLYKGYQVNGGICQQHYNNGWLAYCADCGEVVWNMLIYGKRDTIKEITNMPSQGTYLYICPYCHGLEQGVEYTHLCKAVSSNRYKIVYEKNSPKDSDVFGYMPETKHMYANALHYNGKSAAEQGYGDTKLRKNSYICKGYIFMGWSTTPDGGRVDFLDGQEVLNLCSTDNGKVVLYAQWKEAYNELCVDASGGTYLEKQIYSVRQRSESTYTLSEEYLIPPSGWKVQFEENGGSQVVDIDTDKSFSHWSLGKEFLGKFAANEYKFPQGENNVDTIKAWYKDELVRLPYCTKENEYLVGWYKDPECMDKDFVGKAYEEVCFSENTVLYAKWMPFLLTSIEDYDSYNGVGAVDLQWSSNVSEPAFYKLFQSKDKEKWKNIYEAYIQDNTMMSKERFGVKQQGIQYHIQYAGYYRIQALGAKGSDCGKTNIGGSGGSVSADYWLQSDDILSFFSGTSGKGAYGGMNGNRADGGDSKTQAGGGGGAGTEVYLTRNGVTELLMIAGGGGGANVNTMGTAGGMVLTDIGIKSGDSGELCGGGGGASGGKIESISVPTTIQNPGVQNIAFKSGWSDTFPIDTMLHVEWDELRNPLLFPEKFLNQEEKIWFNNGKNIIIGDLARPLIIKSENEDDDEYHYASRKNEVPQAGNSPSYYVYQSSEGFVRRYSAVYPVKDNTNLVLSGMIDAWGKEVGGNIRFRISDADSGKILHDKVVADGSSHSNIPEEPASWTVGVWSDFDVSGKKNVQVDILIYGYARNAHYSTRILDTFFYGNNAASTENANGGSSYVNTSYGCRNILCEGGTNAGDGYCELEFIDVGYLQCDLLENIYAPDLEAPEQVKEYTVYQESEKQYRIIWSEPGDAGTKYYHTAKEYMTINGETVHTRDSNITDDVLVSGLKGYYYYVDGLPVGTVTADCSYVENRELYVEGSETLQYLHLAAVDTAGNIGKTLDIALEHKESEQELVMKNTEVFTKQLYVKDTEFVYEAEPKIYYVKADGITEHTVMAGGYVDTLILPKYQINRLEFQIERDYVQEWFRVRIPGGNVNVREELFTNDMLHMEKSDLGDSWFMGQSAMAFRKSHGIELELLQTFTVPTNAGIYKIYPKVGLEMPDNMILSKDELDRKHDITIIPDKEPPIIEGMDTLDQLDLLNMGQDILVTELYAYDMLSGLDSFSLTVTNLDNYMSADFECDENGKIRLEIDKDNPLFAGQLEISAIAVDRVGNGSVIGDEGLTFTLDAHLYCERYPEECTAKAGDGMVLEIVTTGYVEKVQVEFPEEMILLQSDLNRVYEYEYPYLRKSEKIKFSVPLELAENEYKLMVSAYKNDRVLTKTPVMLVVKGSVLEELRTRIRNNG